MTLEKNHRTNGKGGREDRGPDEDRQTERIWQILLSNSTVSKQKRKKGALGKKRVAQVGILLEGEGGGLNGD